jgi:peroxiredoxin Q/BCP
MEAYRDQYASVFRGGRGVSILAVSNDPAEALFSWAKDADFPVLFGSDPEGSAPAAFGVGARGNGMPQSRAVVVVDPEGRVAWATDVFREIDPTAYEELAAAVAAVALPLDADDAEEDNDAQAAASTPERSAGTTDGC